MLTVSHTTCWGTSFERHVDIVYNGVAASPYYSLRWLSVGTGRCAEAGAGAALLTVDGAALRPDQKGAPSAPASLSTIGVLELAVGSASLKAETQVESC